MCSFAPGYADISQPAHKIGSQGKLDCLPICKQLVRKASRLPTHSQATDSHASAYFVSVSPFMFEPLPLMS